MTDGELRELNHTIRMVASALTEHAEAIKELALQLKAANKKRVRRRTKG